ncbi:oxidoreductase [Rubellimicrobium sp. CFH 75288]|uniref:oxidoreductase n=1 Tax=Rubellimicrobium sp. CFH 75288 TaxID=2697034 RepID=UPI0014134D36|nr:oxidoreductase [Rubellimicrobium sp. CFH 75288]NAZ35654.1 SDR family oxidoreductase [Rubellimicrobium sp. CFH 75288]
MKAELGGAAVLVTGAASGIGAAVARQAARSGAGALALVDRDGPGCRRMADELAAFCRTEAIEADLAQSGQARDAAARALDRLGRLDGLVNAAGLTTRGSVIEGSAGTWDALLAVNARAPFLLMSALLAHLRARGAPGAIVNILSMHAHGGAPDLGPYAASKAALLALTRNVAHAHLRDRIRANGINLGWVATEAEHRMQAETLGQGEDWAERAAARLPLGRLIAPEEVARLVVFLLSDASVPLTGAIIDLEQWIAGAPPP